MPGGAGSTELLSADLDGNGSIDFLVAEHPVSLLGSCGGESIVTVFLFDEAGRPLPWRFSTFGTVRPVGRPPVFRAIDCERRVTERYTVVRGRFVPSGTSSRGLLPGYGERIDERITELAPKQWPEWVITEHAEKREILIVHSWQALTAALRNGWRARRMGEWLWVDAKEPSDRANLVVELLASDDGPSGGEFSSSPAERGLWRKVRGGTEVELMTDGVTVRTAHTAMGHTVASETRFERPPGGERLLGIAEIGDFLLTQWGPRLYAVHSQRGELLAPSVPYQRPGPLVNVRGKLRWRRED